MRALTPTLSRGEREKPAAPAWFAACGTPLGAAEKTTTAAYLATLGLPALPVAAVAGWREAAETARREDWSRRWWDVEEAERALLYRAAVDRMGETTLLAALTRAMEESAEAIQAAANEALARAGIEDAMLSRVAAGAASQACHHKALADSAGRGTDHGFVIKYGLYRGGRWLLGVVGDRCFVF